MFLIADQECSDKDIAYSTPGDTGQAGPPRRSRKYFWPLLLVAIALRLELSRWLQFRLQCNKPGVEVGVIGYLLDQELIIAVSPARPACRLRLIYHQETEA